MGPLFSAARDRDATDMVYFVVCGGIAQIGRKVGIQIPALAKIIKGCAKGIFLPEGSGQGRSAFVAKGCSVWTRFGLGINRTFGVLP